MATTHVHKRPWYTRKTQWEGTGATREDATHAAATNARSELGGPTWVKVVAIYARVENPITEYKVIVEEG
jgi:hypothetical protein